MIRRIAPPTARTLGIALAAAALAGAARAEPGPGSPPALVALTAAAPGSAEARPGADLQPGLDHAYLAYRPVALSLGALYGDAADRDAGAPDRQWSWDARLLNLGARVDLDERTKVLSQVTSGETLMGIPGGGHAARLNVGYTAAYVLASHQEGRNTFTGRLDYFETSDRNFDPAVDDEVANWSEKGWAITGAYHVALARFAQLRLEALHVYSNRPARGQTGIPRKQTQTLVQSSLRLTF